MPQENKQKVIVSIDEETKIVRSLLSWLNTCPEKPVDQIDFEYLDDNSTGVSLFSIQAAFKTKQYILGGYQAQYQFKLVYRLQPDDMESRLTADEILNRIGAWAERNASQLSIGKGARVVRIRRDSCAALFAVYDDGTVDHQILMQMIYEVI